MASAVARRLCVRVAVQALCLAGVRVLLRSAGSIAAGRAKKAGKRRANASITVRMLCVHEPIHGPVATAHLAPSTRNASAPAVAG
jgi:hypothetical protein